MKKNIFRYSGKILLGALIATGCSDYLKEDSGDLLIPKKVEEFSPMLYAEGYPSDFNDDVSWFKLMTDDVDGVGVGSAGVIGPMRMDYSKVVSVLDCIGKTIGDLENEEGDSDD